MRIAWSLPAVWLLLTGCAPAAAVPQTPEPQRPKLYAWWPDACGESVALHTPTDHHKAPCRRCMYSRIGVEYIEVVLVCEDGITLEPDPPGFQDGA